MRSSLSEGDGGIATPIASWLHRLQVAVLLCNHMPNCQAPRVCYSIPLWSRNTLLSKSRTSINNSLVTFNKLPIKQADSLPVNTHSLINKKKWFTIAAPNLTLLVSLPGGLSIPWSYHYRQWLGKIPFLVFIPRSSIQSAPRWKAVIAKLDMSILVRRLGMMESVIVTCILSSRVINALRKVPRQKRPSPGQ